MAKSDNWRTAQQQVAQLGEQMDELEDQIEEAKAADPNADTSALEQQLAQLKQQHDAAKTAFKDVRRTERGSGGGGGGRANAPGQAKKV